MEQLRHDCPDREPVAGVPKAEERRGESVPAWGPVQRVFALEGTVNGKQIRGRFRRMDDSRFPLLSRGFHWVNERPFNR